MTSYEFEVAAKNAVIHTIQETYGEVFHISDIQFTSFYHILGNKKATLIDTGKNNRYYEVTYDLINNAMYVDVYDKQVNVRIPGESINFTAES